MRTEWKRGLRATVAGLAVAFAAIGVAHAPFARPLLMRLGGCPMAGAKMTPKESENARHLALGIERGATPAPARPALGFLLDRTTAADVHAWAKRTAVDCDDLRVGLLRCSHVPAVALGLPANEPDVDDLTLELDGQGRLVNMTAMRSHLTATDASRAAHAVLDSLATQLGPAGTAVGDFGQARLSARGAVSISTVAYRYSDYVADVTAMNAPSGGPSVREHYMSARD
jgi:hypothetical protein